MINSFTFIVVSLFVFGCSSKIFAANDSTFYDYDKTKTYGTASLNRNYLDNYALYSGEIGILRGEEHSADHSGIELYGMRYTSEFTVIDKKVTVGLKAGYEHTMIFIMFRGSAGLYSNGSNYNLMLIPEVGISVLGRAHFSFGGNIVALGSSLFKSSFRLSLTANIIN